MRQTSSHHLYDYWNALRGSALAPDRARLDPHKISGILSDTFILQVDHWKSLPFRLVGSRTNSLFIRELKGYPFTHLFTLTARPEIKSAIEWISEDGVPLIAGVRGHAPYDRQINLELLLLPLLHENKLDQRILGSLSLSEKPEWIGLIAIDHLEITSLRILNPSQSAKKTTSQILRLAPPSSTKLVS